MFSIGVGLPFQAQAALGVKIGCAGIAAAAGRFERLNVGEQFALVLLMRVKAAVAAIRATVSCGSEVACCPHEMIMGYGTEGE